MVTFTGVECHNEWEITFEEIHRNAAIAHAIFNYTTYHRETKATNWRRALERALRYRALLRRARALQQAHGQTYMIHGVTGPNEYENNVNNNWYTNRMAAWCIEYFCDAIQADSKSVEARAGRFPRRALPYAGDFAEKPCIFLRGRRNGRFRTA